VDRLNDEHIGLAHRPLLEIELHQIAGELDDAADASKRTLESVAIVITEHRALRPYQ
jgi:hypothetical protein